MERKVKNICLIHTSVNGMISNKLELLYFTKDKNPLPINVQGKIEGDRTENNGIKAVSGYLVSVMGCVLHHV